VLMTNSGKFAHYSPGNIGLQVVYGSLEECVRSAAAGEVWRDKSLWAGERRSGGTGEEYSVGQYSVGQLQNGSELTTPAALVTRQSSLVTPRVLVPGRAAAPALVLDAPLSLWGGLDPETGNIIDQRHPQCGRCVTGRVLVMPVGKGSSSASSILLEAVRLGTAPAAIVLAEPDGILALGAAVARELYGVAPPVVVAGEDYGRIRDSEWIDIGESKVME